MSACCKHTNRVYNLPVSVERLMPRRKENITGRKNMSATANIEHKVDPHYTKYKGVSAPAKRQRLS